MFSLAKFIARGAKSGISKDLLLNAICRHCVFLPSKMQEQPLLRINFLQFVGIKIIIEKTLNTISKLQLKYKMQRMQLESNNSFTEKKLLKFKFTFETLIYFSNAILLLIVVVIAITALTIILHYTHEKGQMIYLSFTSAKEHYLLMVQQVIK